MVQTIKISPDDKIKFLESEIQRKKDYLSKIYNNSNLVFKINKDIGIMELLLKEQNNFHSQSGMFG